MVGVSLRQGAVGGGGVGSGWGGGGGEGRGLLHLLPLANGLRLPPGLGAAETRLNLDGSFLPLLLLITRVVADGTGAPVVLCVQGDGVFQRPVHRLFRFLQFEVSAGAVATIRRLDLGGGLISHGSEVVLFLAEDV